MWKGPAQKLQEFQQAMAAIDPANLSFTWDVCNRAAVFLDVNVYKGAFWAATSRLDTSVFQKAVNKYLYLPFSTETPRHVLLGFIKGELLRYIKRCSSETDFLEIRARFWDRLRARGYPAGFLSYAFRQAPRHSARLTLFRVVEQSQTTERKHVLIVNYSAIMARATLSRALYAERYLLPMHLRSDFLVAWRVPRKLAALLVPFRFNLPPPTDDGTNNT